MTMDWTAVLDALISTQTPALPAPALMRITQPLSWAIVLTCIVMWVGRRWPRRLQFGLAGLLFVWTLIPGPVSPAFWLGLAFQMPSLTSGVVGLLIMVSILRTGSCSPGSVPASLRAFQWAGLGGVLLGWLLLLDTFAVLPLSLYALGFSPVVLGVAALLASLSWMVFGSQQAGRPVSFLLGAVLLLYVLLRLPTGNVWDALIDPLLWIALQLGWLLRAARWLSERWRARAPTRA